MSDEPKAGKKEPLKRAECKIETPETSLAKSVLAQLDASVARSSSQAVDGLAGISQAYARKMRNLDEVYAKSVRPFESPLEKLAATFASLSALGAPFPHLSSSQVTTSRLESDERSLESEIARLRGEINGKKEELQKAINEGRETTVKLEEMEKAVLELTNNIKELNEKESLSYLLGRVGNQGKSKILGSPDFRAMFNNESPCDAFVLSVDIRRSTELMLKAREPKLFAQFIISLAAKLRQAVLDNFGVFDKFTGDGILGFFPDFYSGSDAGYYAVKAAAECHQIFKAHYEQHRNSFISILLDTGLGIGIDFGKVQIVEVAGDISVVGSPVVYACRMAGANAGETYTNYPAYEALFEKYDHLDFEMKELLIKHEGRTLAYGVHSNGKRYEPSIPAWCSEEDQKECPSEGGA